MKPGIMVPAVALIGVMAVGCDGPQPTESLGGGPLFTTTRSAITATLGPTTVETPGRTRVSADGIIHVRDQTEKGLINGDIVGMVTLVTNANVALETGDGVGFGTFVITTSEGTWEGRFQGPFDGGLGSGSFVAHGAGAFEGLILKGAFVETGAETNTFAVTGEIIDPGS